ncbi:hypothetical protein [Phyllobacterium sp. P5_D12]
MKSGLVPPPSPGGLNKALIFSSLASGCDQTALSALFSPWKVTPTATQTGAASTGTTTSSSEGQTAKKDGQTIPLANKEGGGDPNLATSQQDVNAQQKGDQTAMAKAEECKE